LDRQHRILPAALTPLGNRLEANMSINLKNMHWFWIAGFALVSLGELGCLTDDADPEADTNSTSSTNSTTGSGGASSTASSTTGNSTSGDSTTGSTPDSTACAAPITLASSTPGIADFELYDGTDLPTWSFALGGDAATGVFSGPFRYGDDEGGFPETFEAVDGHDSTYALSISDTLAEEYGGGMGLWLSNCVNASAFAGISFWVRGDAPAGEAKFSLLMEESTWEMADSVGTCAAASEELCVHPSAMVTVSDEWTQIQLPWSAFTAGSTPAGAVTVDGTNIWQIQFDVGLEWIPDDPEDENSEYHPAPSGYEFALDDVTFY
jgi:hypothetical protein